MLGRKGLRIATIFGLPIRIDPTWFIVLALLSWTLASYYFPQQFEGAGQEGLSTAQYWILGVGSAILLFASVLLHELGHAVAAKKSNMPVEGITLFMFGGVSELGDTPPGPGAEAKVTLCGWLISAVLAVIFYIVYRSLPSENTSGAIATAMFRYLALVNGLLFAFNGLPGFPLDGGRLLRALIWRVTGSLRKATYYASNIGAGFGLFLIIWGIASFLLTRNLVGGVWLALIGMFLRSGAHAAYSQLLIRRALQGVPVSDLMTRDPVTVEPDLSLQQVIDDYFMKHHFHSFPVAQDGAFRGILSLNDIKEVDPSKRGEMRVADVVEQDEEAMTTIAPDADAMDALEIMSRTGRGRIPVTEGERLVGIVSRRDVMHFLAVKTDLVPEGKA